MQLTFEQVLANFGYKEVPFASAAATRLIEALGDNLRRFEHPEDKGNAVILGAKEAIYLLPCCNGPELEDCEFRGPSTPLGLEDLFYNGLEMDPVSEEVLDAETVAGDGFPRKG